MLNGRLISQIFGSLLFLEAILMAVCLPISLIYGQHDLWAFLITIAIIVATGLGFRALGKGADNNMSRRDAYFVVTATWLLFSFFGMIPFLLCPLFAPPGDTMAPLSFTDAFFETISGFTTTGATVIDDVEALPKGLLFWRSLTQWIGGLGIVFFTIAVLPSMVGGSVRVFSAEATGPIRSKLHPRLSTGAKWIWMVYIILTVACVGSFLLCGMDWFNALNFAMTSTATGGFSTTNGSLASFHSPAEEYVCTLFCFLAGINFMLLYGAVAKMQLKRLFLNAEFRFYLLLTVLAVAFIMAELMLRSGYSLEPAFRYSLFQVVSFLTSTGLFNADAGQWPRRLFGLHERRHQEHPRSDAAEDCAQRVPTYTASQCRVAPENRRHQRATGQARHAAGLHRTLFHTGYGVRLRDDSIGHRPYQLGDYHAELPRQHRPYARTRDRAYHVVGHAACVCQVDMRLYDARWPSRAVHSIGYLHPGVLEGTLSIPFFESKAVRNESLRRAP